MNTDLRTENPRVTGSSPVPGISFRLRVLEIPKSDLKPIDSLD